MSEVLVGPILRHLDHYSATVWVELDRPGEVEILGATAPTFTVEGHHYAIVTIEGLEAGKAHPYEVSLDGERLWPPTAYDLPQPVIRPVPEGGDITLAFGSCRVSAPHHPPYTWRKRWHPKGCGKDALLAYALRMLRSPCSTWPDALLMLGDQLYADQPPERVARQVAPRRVHPDGPVEVLEDFEEFTVGYRDVWGEPVVRWLLSNLPTSMIFDDHEIEDKWKTSQPWLDRMRQQDWYADRVFGGIMAYWIYQHLGNLSPTELREDDVLHRLHELEDGGEYLRGWAEEAEQQTDRSRFSFDRNIGSARLVVLDSRAGRTLGEGERRIMDRKEWKWVSDHAVSDKRHLILASSLPFLLSRGMHDGEAWAEAVGNGAWGERFKSLGERARIAANLDHWACFQDSYREFEQLVIDLAQGRCGRPPQSIVMLAGDVHHCWVSEVGLPAEEGPTETEIWQVVCSGLRKELKLNERLVLGFGHTGLARVVGGILRRTARVAPPRLRWRPISRRFFHNQIGTLIISGDEVGVKLEEIAGPWKDPRLAPMYEGKLSG
ncbi:MAG: alkaline phosphatase D family protein [Solirubrobacterales bacterium]